MLRNSRNFRFELTGEYLLVKFEMDEEVWNSGGYMQWVETKFTFPLSEAGRLMNYLQSHLANHVEKLKVSTKERAIQEKKELEAKLAQLDAIIKS